jgi:rhodanese-related sulfurtransferase
MYKKISYEKTFNEITKTIILDVRSENEYKNGHIESSINLPLDKIENIKYNKDTKIIVYCQSGNRSKQAALKLIGMGYTNIYDMGGINDWPYDIVED